MPLTLPASVHDPSSGATIPSTWGDAVNAAIDYVGATKPRAGVYNSANISITTATETVLTFDSERYDVGGMHSTVTNTSRLTVPTGEGGLYAISGCVAWAINGTGYRALIIRMNGTTHLVRGRKPADGAGDEMNVYREYRLAAGDYVELAVYQTSGGALNVNAAGSYSPEFTIRWIGT